MRLSEVTTRVGAFILAAVISGYSGQAAVTIVEDRSAASVTGALIDSGHFWTRVKADGLQVILEGEAPNEAARFRAISAAGSMVDASRVIDNMSVVDTAGAVAPDFAIEILRNDSGISLIGLIPASTDRDHLHDQLQDASDGQEVSDLLDAADYPPPEGWTEAMAYALRSLSQLPRSKISVGAGWVSITAISDSPQQKRQLEQLLTRTVPASVRLELTVTAPRPVISPFTTRFTLDESGPRFSACAADTEAARDVILRAAHAAGIAGPISCTLGLGVPSATWSEAVSLSIAAITRLGGGTVTLSDTDIALVALEGVDATLFDDAVGELANALPDLFTLTAERPVPAEAAPEGVPEFTAVLSPEGAAQLRGRVPDDLINQTAESVAIARFGENHVTMGTRVVEGLPAGWSLRVLTGIEALAELQSGSVIVRPDEVLVRGISDDNEASARISRLLISKLGEQAVFDINIQVIEPPPVVVETGPAPEECLARIIAITDQTKILFDPGSATLTASTRPVIDQIAEVLRECKELPMEVSGYTDSQGRDEMNQRLSLQRAESVLSALRARRVLTASFVAVGYGEADPIADNETEEGREANRRIEFRLLTADELAAAKAARDAPRGAEDGSAGDGAADAAADAAPPADATDTSQTTDDQGSGD